MCVLLTCQCSSWLIVPEFHPGSATDPHCVHRLLWIHLGYVPLLFPPERRWNHDGSSGLDSWRAQTRATDLRKEQGWTKLSKERFLRCSYSSYLYSIHSFCFCFCNVKNISHGHIWKINGDYLWPVQTCCRSTFPLFWGCLFKLKKLYLIIPVILVLFVSIFDSVVHTVPGTFSYFTNIYLYLCLTGF